MQPCSAYTLDWLLREHNPQRWDFISARHQVSQKQVLLGFAEIPTQLWEVISKPWRLQARFGHALGAKLPQPSANDPQQRSCNWDPAVFREAASGLPRDWKYMLGMRAPRKVLVIPHQHRVNSRKAAATAAGCSVRHTLGRGTALCYGTSLWERSRHHCFQEHAVPLSLSTSTCFYCNIHLQSVEKPAAWAASLAELGQDLCPACNFMFNAIRCYKVLFPPHTHQWALPVSPTQSWCGAGRKKRKQNKIKLKTENLILVWYTYNISQPGYLVPSSVEHNQIHSAVTSSHCFTGISLKQTEQKEN